MKTRKYEILKQFFDTIHLYCDTERLEDLEQINIWDLEFWNISMHFRDNYTIKTYNFKQIENCIIK